MIMFAQEDSRPTSTGSLAVPYPILVLVAFMLICVAAGCGRSPQSRDEIVGVYRQTLPAGDGLERIYTLDLRADGSCVFSRQYVKKGTVVMEGTWTNQNSTIGVTVQAMQPKKPKSKTKSTITNEPPQVFEFKWTGTKEGAQITATKWDESLHGSEGLGTFTKISATETNTLTSASTNTSTAR